MRAFAKDQDLLIEVGNSGPEIPELEKDRMFERYYRLESRRKGSRSNRGLGLYFCRLAAIAHQGTISVVNRPELPACFELKLPNCVL
jgi:signal transduction histidine kinase